MPSPRSRATVTFSSLFTRIFRLLTVLDMDNYEYNINRNNKDFDDNTNDNGGSDEYSSVYDDEV